MGGLGKTTLAQLVFKEARTKSHFHTVIWVSVSDFNETKIAKEIIRRAGVDVPEYLSEWNDELHQLLRDSVKKKRFFLVLDDMWMEDREKWKPFRLAFKEAAPGSQILVTTRNQSVADAIDSNYSYPLGILSEENCWQLFSHLAFHLEGKNANKKEINEWKQTGTSIANKCKGVPLSAIVLGNHLRQKDEIKEWKTVMDIESIWELENAQDGILKPALLLSYYDLAPPERACFVYCAIFPKGYQIHKDELISLWMAQGLILFTGSGGGEAVGNKYFNNLAARSFFHNFVKDTDGGNIISCNMHDLVHDFAQFLTKGEYLTLADTSSCPPSENLRHLTLLSENSFNQDTSLVSASNGERKLRSLLVLNIPLQLKTILPDFLLKYLRVLIIRGSDLECLGPEIGKLIHLRYLDLCYNPNLTGLPDSLCNLYNLQTLNVSHCSELRNLPQELGRMINLRCLRLEYNRSLECLPQGIGKLISLRTLTGFDVRIAGGSNIKLLKDLDQLEGHLSILGLDRVKSSEDADEAKLNNKKNLQSLLLDFAVINHAKQSERRNPEIHYPEEYVEIVQVEPANHVLASLKPPSLLRKLEIMNYKGSELPNWIADDGMLSYLRDLILDSCDCVELPGLGKLPSLEHLSILDMHQLKHIGPEFYGVDGDRVAFPQLKTLRILRASGLEHWDDSKILRSMPLVHEIELDDCIKLEALPAFGKLPSLECLNISSLHSVKHIGTEFYGDGGGGLPFPKLEKLRIKGVRSLEKWESSATPGMPCLGELELHDCIKLEALPSFGKLPSLEKLNISSLHNVKHIVAEFYGDGGGLPFPKLKKLRIEGARSLEKWDSSATMGMPCLGELELCGCNSLRVLPAFGKLPLLQYLYIDGLHKLERLGHEFYGDVGGHSVGVAFPKLEKLEIQGARILVEWDAFATLGTDVMPCLQDLKLGDCGLTTLPALGKLPLLKQLEIRGLGNLRRIGSEFYGANRVAFPKLEKLDISRADSLEEWVLSEEECSDHLTIMPRLRQIYIWRCGALLKLPALGKLQSLEILSITDMNSLKQIGEEFYGINGVSFPKLLALYMEVKLEVWGFRRITEGDEDGAVVMPCVRHIHIKGLKVKRLPALGNLPSLETLKLSDLENVARLGPEFYGTDVAATRAPVFPKLYQLHLLDMPSLIQWNPGYTESTGVMPCLRDLEIRSCFYLYSLPDHLSDTLLSLSWDESRIQRTPALGKLKVLQHLNIFMCSWPEIPREIRDMRSLRTFSVGASPHLEEDCTRYPDKENISHIPNIRIGGRIICGNF